MSLTSTEWTDFVTLHNRRFPGFSDYVDQHGSLAQVWYSVLSRWDLAELDQASEALTSHPEKDAPLGAHGELLTAVVSDATRGSSSAAAQKPRRPKRKTQKSRSKPREQYTPDKGRYAHRCGLCQGSGLVSVVYADETPGVTPMGNEITRGAVACKCDHGQALNDYRDPRMDTYDATRMTPSATVVRIDPLEMLETLRETEPRLADQYEQILESRGIEVD